MKFSQRVRAFFAERRIRRDNPYPVGTGGVGRLGGVYVDHERAQQVAAVWACMDVIASALSSSDWNVYGGVRGADKKQALPQDGLQFILNTRLNDEMTAQSGKRAIALAAVGFGTGYAEIVRDMSGRITALWPILPSRVMPMRDLDTGRLFYRVSQPYSGGFVDMDPADLFIMRGASLLGFSGDDMVSKAIRTIATAIAIDEFSNAFFANNGTLGTVFTYKGRMDDTHYQRNKAELDKKYSGVVNSFKNLFLDGSGDWDVKTVSNNAKDSQLVDIKYVSIEDICRWFHVPPHKIAHLLRATNNNIEHQGLEFSRDTLRPWVKEIEQEADYKLVPYRAQKFVELDVEWAEQGDFKSRAEAYQILRNIGVYSTDHILRKLGENTIGPALGGDILYVQGANVKLQDVGKNMLPAGEQTETPEVDSPPAANAQNFLTSVYAQAQLRWNERREDLAKKGKGSRAHDDAKAEIIREARFAIRTIGEHLNVAHAEGFIGDALNGMEPHQCAAAALKVTQ